MVRKYLRSSAIILSFSFLILTAMNTPPGMAAGESGNITGTWVANGTKDVLPFGKQREAALFKLSGHVNLDAGVARQTDYWAECIGLADSASGSDVRCVWRALNGQEIYIVLTSQRLTEGASVSGDIVGGTGLAAGISGSLSFHWSTMSFQKQDNVTAVGGYATDLAGSFQLP